MNDVNENSEKTSEGKNRLAEIEQKIREYGIVSNVDSSEKNLKGLDDAQYDYELFLITLGTLYPFSFCVVIDLDFVSVHTNANR